MKKIIFAISIGCAAIISGCAVSKKTGEIQTGQHPKNLTKEIKTTISVDYLLYIPKDYSNDKKWPLVLFLHGAGERGSDLNLVQRHGPSKLVAEGKDFPFILVSPQCPENQWWNTDPQIEILDRLLKYIQKNYSVDSDRIYITGLSMGGFGTWKMLERYPDRFAAAVPICGGGDSAKACLAKDVPIWVFHGQKDNVVPIREDAKMVDAIKRMRW